MAMTLTTVKNNNFETIIHFASSLAETGTIDIATLTAPDQALTVGGTPTVDIVKFWCAGALTSRVVITRNSKIVIACAPENAPYSEFNAWGIPVNNDNTSNIVIDNQVAAAVAGWLVLRKVSGWSTKIEPATFGSYDDPTAVGS